MPVNGIEIKVGQKWRTRNGAIVVVAKRVEDRNYPWELTDKTSVTENGSFYVHTGEMGFDLFSLIEDVPTSKQVEMPLTPDKAVIAELLAQIARMQVAFETLSDACNVIATQINKDQKGGA